jgi:hypothetical protein
MTAKMNLPLILAFTALTLSPFASALASENNFPIQGRLFVGNTFISPTELNNEMAAQGLQKFTGIPEIGVEITYPLIRLLDVGMRYTRKGATQYDVGSTTSTTNRGDIRQDSILLLARVPFVRTSLFKFDVFAGLGGNNTTFEIKSAAENGQLTKKASSSYWFASPEFSAGASAGLGFQKVFLFLEGGYDRARATGLSRTGNVGSNVSAIDISGPYVMLGLLFDGISSRKN